MKRLGLFLLAIAAQAKIKDDGIWDGQDWYDTATKIGVKKGVPYSDDENIQRRITSPIAADGEIDDWMDKENVKRV